MNDTHLIKISGKAELPKPIDIGHNFRVALSGSVTSVNKSDNENGEFTFTYLFKPITVEVLTALGETIKAKDTRSASQLLRARFWAIWKNGNYPDNFDTWYQKLMIKLLENAKELTEMYCD